MTLSRLDVVSWAKGRRATGLQYGTPATFEASDDGASGGNTIVSSDLAAVSDSDDDFVGMWVKVVSGVNGPGYEEGHPIMRRIVEYADATGTATLNDGLGFQSSDGDVFELLDPPTGYLAADSAGKTLSVVDLSQAMADDYWVGSAEQGGPYLTVVEADSISKSSHPRVADSVSATGLVSLAAALDASTAVGDLFEVWEHPEIITGGDITAKRERIERPVITGRIGQTHGLAGLVSGGGQATLHYRGPGQGREGSAAEIDTVFGCPFDASAQSSVTLDSGSSGTTLQIASGTPVAGHLYMLDTGDVVMCVSYSAPAMTVTPAPRSDPAVGVVAYPLRRYISPADYNVNYVVPIERWYGSRVWEHLFDCVPKISMDFERGQPTKINVEWVASQASGKQRTASSRAWRAVRPTVTEKMLGHLRVCLGSTELEVRKATLDMGLEYEIQTNMSAPEMSDGYSYRRDHPSGTIEAWLDADNRSTLLYHEGGEGKRLLIQAGHGHGDNGTLAFWAEEIELLEVPIGDEGGKRTVTISWQCVEDTTQSTLPWWALGSV